MDSVAKGTNESCTCPEQEVHQSTRPTRLEHSESKDVEENEKDELALAIWTEDTPSHRSSFLKDSQSLTDETLLLTTEDSLGKELLTKHLLALRGLWDNACGKAKVARSKVQEASLRLRGQRQQEQGRLWATTLQKSETISRATRTRFLETREAAQRVVPIGN